MAFKNAYNFKKYNKVNVKAWGATGDGTTNDYTDIAKLITGIWTVNRVNIVFPAGIYKLSSNTVFTANITCEFESGAILKPDANISVTILGNIVAYGVFMDLTASGSSLVGAIKGTSGIVTPVSTVVPNFVGEEYLDTVTKIWYKSTGLTNANWVALN